MNEINKSEFKDTESVKAIINKYNINSLLFALGIFVLVIAIIPYFYIENPDILRKILPSLIIALVAIILIVIGKIGMNKAYDRADGKYTVAAFEYINSQRKLKNKNFRKDLVIALLLIILIPLIYYIVYNRTNFIPERFGKYLYTVLFLLLAIALFIILYSKGRKDAYKILG